MRIGLIVGSLRKASWNRKVAEAVKGLFGEGFEADFIEIGDVPLYNQEFDEGMAPESYVRLRREAREHDGFIFFTPEYNRSYAPAVKNAIDVVSRDPEGSGWAGKPVAVFSASPGRLGGMAANHALRQTFVNLDMMPMQLPEVYLSNIDSGFDGDVPNEHTLGLLKKAVDGFCAHAKKFA